MNNSCVLKLKEFISFNIPFHLLIRLDSYNAGFKLAIMKIKRTFFVVNIEHRLYGKNLIRARLQFLRKNRKLI